MKKLVKSILAAGLMATSFNLMADESQNEQLSIKPVAQDLVVDMQPTKDSFNPNEAIKFNIKGNQDFFLYVFAVDETNKQVTMMLPNKFQKGNKYNANQMHRVPNATEMELFSDRAGTEKIVMLASRKYLPWDTKGYTEAGKYMATEQERFDSQLEALNVRDVPQQTPVSNPDVLLKEMSITIAEDKKPADSPLVIQLSAQDQTQPSDAQKPQDPKADKDEAMGDKSIVFVSMDKNHYSGGDHAYMVYGADRPGFIHLIVLDSKKHYSKLTTHEVDGKSIYRLKAQTDKQKGKNKLIAAWSKDEKLDVNSIPELRKSKGESLEAFKLVDESASSYNVFEFKVK